MIRYIIVLLIIFISCEDPRDWGNPYDPRSNRSLWTPSELSAQNIKDAEGHIKLKWIQEGRGSNGFIIDKKIGDDNWQDSIKILDDSILEWIDTLDLTILVNKLITTNPIEYKYRVYAYAIMENGDTNVSNYSNPGIVEPGKPGNPIKLKIIDIIYEFPKMMTVKWTTSPINFNRYEIYHAFSNDFENKTLFKTVYDSNTSSLDTSNFDVLKENWFWIALVDSMGQTNIDTLGEFEPINEKPEPVILDSIIFDNDQFKFKWSKAVMDIKIPIVNDFSSYMVEEITLPDSSLTSIVTINSINDLQESISIPKDIEKFYIIKLNDHWGNATLSNIQPASSFQKIVTVDFIRDLGDDLTIYNNGPSLFFQNKKTGINAKFPIWIQNGKKIFALVENNMGIVYNADGSIYRNIIEGKEPQDISFDENEGKAVYTGEDHNLYYVDFTASNGEVVVQIQDNNEWFSDPEIIGDNEILYSQIKNPNLNNLGPQGLFTSGLDGLDIKEIHLSKPDKPNLQGKRYLMPRMSPNKDKILYVRDNESLYVLEVDTNRDSISDNILKTEGNNNIIPEKSLYFRNIRWSPDGTKAIFWTKDVEYNLYIYNSILNPSIVKLLQPGARYADWISNDEVIFRFENANTMYSKNINEPPLSSPIVLIKENHPAYNSPWAQLQPR